MILKATKVDGIYTADPMMDPHGHRYETISYLQVLEKRLQVMDATAISLCMDNKLPIVVFNLRTPGNLRRAVSWASRWARSSRPERISGAIDPWTSTISRA